MESNRKPNSGENSQTNAPDRGEKSRHYDSHKTSGSRSHSQSSSKNKPSHREKERKSTNSQSSDRRYYQRSDYQNHRNSHRSYAEATYEYNRHRSNSNRHYNNDWHRNTRPNRKSRWDSGPRYGNRTWQRNNLNQTDETFQNPPPEYWSNDPAQGNFQNFQNSVELLSSICNLLTQDNQSIERSQDPSGSQNFFPQPDYENQQCFDDAQGYRVNPENDARTGVDQGQNYLEQAPSTTTSENSSFLDRWQGAVDRFDERTEQRAETRRLEEVEKENSETAQAQIEETTDLPRSENLNDKELPQPQSQSPSAELSELITHSPAQTIQESLNPEGISIKAEPEDVEIDKPTIPDALDLDFDCLNDHIDNRFPSISVIPISRLIKSELLDLNRPDIIVAPTTPARGKRTLRPNLVKRRKISVNDDTAETLSENLVQRVADMDKVGIKNVINNSGTKYDAALKIQARKRLREEIRKQLKSMNFTPPESSENCVLVPDEIVDSMNIPAVILDEIRKAFGIVLLEDMHVIPDAEKTAVEPPQETVSQEVVEPPKATEEPPSKSPDLMSRIRMLEEVKSQSEKPTSVKNDAPTNKEPRVPRPIIENVEAKRSPIAAKPFDEVMVIDSSSSSSSSSSSDGSDSDSSSSSSGSGRSTTSSYKRRRRKKRILEANVVGNFEKLVLPYLSEAQQLRYNTKYSKTTMSSLLFIHGICVSRINPKCRSMEAREKHKLKHNLTSADNATALEFLMKSILDLFELQKEKRRLEKEKSQQRSKSGASKSSNLVSPTKNRNDSKCNQVTSVNDKGRGQSKNANAAAKQHQSTKGDEAPTPPQEVGANRNDGNFVTESANSAQGVARGGRLVAGDDGLSTEYSGNTPSRLWKSPGEKKCIEVESPPVLSGLGLMNPPLGVHTMDLDALKSQSSLGDEAVSSIREIDVKLMELHKRKMYIEEMILKLQKDKMEVDLWTMKLQNEKFIILNSALANASTSTAAATPPKIEPKNKPKVKTEKKTKPVVKKKKKPVVVRKPQRRYENVIFRDSTNVATSSTSLAKGKAITMPKPRAAQTKRATRQSKTTERSEGETHEDEEIMEVDASNDDTNVKTEEAIVAERLETDYSNVPNGNLDGWKLPITQIIVCGEAIVAASEDGNIYKFNIRTRQLESKFSKHTEAITQIFTCPREHQVYTTSLDGFLKKTSIENFGLELQSLNLQEPLQSIDIAWGTAFIGSRWGNIFTYDIKSNNLSESLLCSAGSSIIAIKATKEGPRKVLIVSSKGNQISFRDASTGLLLRSLDIPDNLHIYSILLDGGSIYCGTQRNEIYQYNFTTGERQAIFQCGNGAVSMKLYKEMYIFVGCYDGFVYVLDKKTGCQIGRFPGSGKMILALEIAGDKLITSAKDNTMQIIDIPKYIVTKVN